MKLAVRPIDIEAIRTDGGTQVRTALDEPWIVELMKLYEEGHEIEPVLVMIDAAGAVWLVDGFHRREALRRLGYGATSARVREGSIEAAKLLAAQVNKNGLPRSAGDKRSAILLALSTVEGKKMGVRDLARHCGVAASYVTKILAGVCSPVNADALVVVDRPKNGKRSVELLWARVDAAIRSEPGKPATEIARDVGCVDKVVRDRRRVLGIPLSRSEAGRAVARPTRDRASELLDQHPDWPNSRIAQEAGASPETVAKLRDRKGLPPSTQRGVRPSKAPAAETPSAPERKDDPRPNAEVLYLRPKTSQRTPLDIQDEVAALEPMHRVKIVFALAVQLDQPTRVRLIKELQASLEAAS